MIPEKSSTDLRIPVLVNRQRVIATAEDKYNITGVQWTRPKEIPQGFVERRNKKGEFLDYKLIEPITIHDVDGRAKHTIKTSHYEPDKRTLKPTPKASIGEYSKDLAGAYHGKLSRNWKQEQLTLSEIIRELNAGYSIAPGLYNNPPDKSFRSSEYIVNCQLILFDGDEWTPEHPAPPNLDELIIRYPDIPQDFYWVGESINSRTYLKPELRTRLMYVLPEPIHKGDFDLWETCIDWIAKKYPFIAREVGIDKVRLSFGNARPECENRVLGGVVSRETFTEWEQTARDKQAKAKAEQEEQENRQAEREARREKNTAITTELKRRGHAITENKDPLREFCEVNHETLLTRYGLASRVSGNVWHWYESSQERSFLIVPGIHVEWAFRIVSGTMQKSHPDPDKKSHVEPHRFILYHLHRLDMTKDSDKHALRCILANEGYGTHPDDYKKAKQVERALAVREGLVSPETYTQPEKRFTVNPDHEHDVSDIDTERFLNSKVVAEWMAQTDGKRGKNLLVLGSAPGTGKTTISVFQSEGLLYIAKTTEEADGIFRELDRHEEDVIRHKPRMFNRGHKDVDGNNDWGTLPLGLDDHQRTCVQPERVNLHAECLGTTHYICNPQICSAYDDCTENGYLSQSDKERNASKVIYAWNEGVAVDANHTDRVKHICRSTDIFVVDEVNPLALTQQRTIDREMLFELLERFRHFHKDTAPIYRTLKALGDLISTADSVESFIVGVKDWIGGLEDIKALDAKIERFPVGVILQETTSNATHNQPFEAVVMYRDKEVSVPVVDFETAEDTPAFYIDPETPIETGEYSIYFLTFDFLLKMGISTLDDPPRKYRNLLGDLKTFFDENEDIETAPFTFDPKGQRFEYSLKPTLNHRRTIFNTASDPDNLIGEAYRDTAVNITRHTGTPPAWKTDLVFQISSGNYLPRHSLVKYGADEKLYLEIRAQELIDTYILPSIKSGLKVLVIAPKAFQKVESVKEWAVTDINDVSEGYNALLINHHHAEGRNDYQDFDIVFTFHYEPNHHEVQAAAKRIFRNPETPLDFTREKKTVTSGGVTFEKQSYTDERVQAVYNRECRGRLMQCDMRLRPNIHADKIIVNFTAEPIDRPVTPVPFSLADKADFTGDWADFKKKLQAKSCATVQERIDAGDSKSKAYRDTKAKREESKAERDAEIIRMHRDGVSQREIERRLKDGGIYKHVSRKVIAGVIKVVHNSQPVISTSYSAAGIMHHPSPSSEPCLESESEQSAVNVNDNGAHPAKEPPRSEWHDDDYYSEEAIRERLKRQKNSEISNPTTLESDLQVCEKLPAEPEPDREPDHETETPKLNGESIDTPLNLHTTGNGTHAVDATEQKNEVNRLYSIGASKAEIHRQTGVDFETIDAWLAENLF